MVDDAAAGGLVKKKIFKNATMDRSVDEDR